MLVWGINKIINLYPVVSFLIACCAVIAIAQDYDVVDRSLEDDFFDNATQYDSGDAVGNQGSSSYSVDSNYVDPNLIPIVATENKKVSDKKNPFGMSFIDIADKTVKIKTIVVEEPKQKDFVKPKKEKRTFGFSFSEMAAFTQDENIVTENISK